MSKYLVNQYVTIIKENKNPKAKTCLTGNIA
jgi:hypothetical protein